MVSVTIIKIQKKKHVSDISNDDSTTRAIDDIIIHNNQPEQRSSTVLSGDIHHHHHYHDDNSSSTTQCLTLLPGNQNLSEMFEKISNQLTVVLIQLQSLHEKTEPLKGKIDSLEEVIGELLKEKDNGTKLVLIGNDPPHGSNVYEAIRGVITDRLELYDLSSSIKLAKFVEGGIMFEVNNSIEKHRIMLRAQERFNTDKRKIVEYNGQKDRTPKSELPEIYYRTSNTNLDSEESDGTDRVLFV